MRNSRTTMAVRRAIQASTDSIRVLAERHGIDPKTVAKWRLRSGVEDRKTGRRSSGSSLLSIEDEALIALFRQHRPLSLDDSLQALQRFLPQLTRSSLHRFLQQHELSRRPGGARNAAADGVYLLSHTELKLAAGRRQLFVAVEPSSGFAFAELHDEASAAKAAGFLLALIGSAPNGVEAVETGAGPVFAAAAGQAAAAGAARPAHAFASACKTHGVLQRFAVPQHRWNARQLARMRHLFERALDREYRDDSLDQLRRKLSTLVAAYNAGGQPAVSGTASRRARAGKPAPQLRPGAPKALAAAKAPRSGSRGPRDPERTREAILQAARSRLAHDGPEGLSLAEVARIAGVNRGTAYQHFETRDKLIAETADWVSEKLYDAVFGDVDTSGGQAVDKLDVAEITDRLAHFAMDNPELCRAWLLKVLSLPDPASDLFWRHYQGSTALFAKTARAQESIDTEVLSVIMLAGAFLWPVWARGKARDGADLRALAHRFAQEGLRISMYGNLRSEHFPDIAARLAAKRGGPEPAAG